MKENKDEQVWEVLSKATGKDKVTILSDLVNLLTEDSKNVSDDALRELADIIKVTNTSNNSGSMIKEVMEATLVDKLAERLGNKSNGDIDLNKVLAFAAIKQLLSPDPTQLVMMERIAKKGGGDDEMLEKFMEIQKQQQEMLQQLLLGKKLEEVREEARMHTEKTTKELKNQIKTLAEKFDQLIYTIQQTATPQQKRNIVKEMEELVKTTKALKELAQEEFDRPIVDNSGKPNIYSLIEKGLKTAEKIGVALAQRPQQQPPQQEITPIEVPPEVPKQEEEKGDYSDLIQVSVQEEKPKEEVKEEPKQVEEQKPRKSGKK